jgi:phosphatidylglycerophosphate synthase
MSAPANPDLRRSAVTSILAAALLALLLVASLRQAADLAAPGLAASLVLLAGGSLLLLRALPAHEPQRHFGPANQLTLLRATLTVVLAALLGAGDSAALQSIALLLAAIAAVLDLADGAVARRRRIASSYGARFDMEADALLILMLCGLAWQFGKAGPWILVSGLLRYAFIAAGRLVPAIANPLPPSRRRQTIAAVQSAGLVVVIAPFVPPAVSMPLAALLLLSLVLSFAIDLAWQLRR